MVGSCRSKRFMRRCANRPVRFENAATQTVIDCGYDSQGRRYFKKVTVAGTVTLHHRYIYRGYLQIACVDCTRSGHPALWLVTWDPSQPTATRPLAIPKDGTWFTYGYDITKNVCELFGPNGYIRTAYSYTPFGSVSASENGVVQNFQWSSEFYDSELDLVYYNFRHYSPALGRFLSRDPIAEQGGLNLYTFVKNRGYQVDILGLIGPFPICEEELDRCLSRCAPYPIPSTDRDMCLIEYQECRKREHEKEKRRKQEESERQIDAETAFLVGVSLVAVGITAVGILTGGIGWILIGGTLTVTITTS